MRKIIVSLIAILTCITTGATQKYPELIEVTGGTFTIGNNYGDGDLDEEPAHEVTLTDYYIGRTEVTVKQYRTYCRAKGISMPEKPEGGWENDEPIVNISWDDAIGYCEWLSDELEISITLPTEAQWEFAARGGNKSQGYKYSGSDDLATVGWYVENSKSKRQPVAKKKANELGLYDMSGNVWEWCFDKYRYDYYENSPDLDPQGPEESSFRVLRGGCWFYPPYYCRNANRGNSVSYARISIGFRIASSGIDEDLDD